MKKILMFVLCVVLAAGLAVPALAAGAVTMTPSATAVNRDGTFTVTVSVSGFTPCKQGSATVSCGNSFELVKGEWLWVEKPLLDYFYADAKEGGFAFDHNVGVAGKVLRLTFKVRSDAAFANDKITVNLTLGSEKASKELSITVACAHKFTEWVDYSASSHFRKCNSCGKTETVEHNYDNACDTDCNTCGRKRVTTHQYAQEWVGDETGHYHVCGICGSKDTPAAHTPGEAAGEYTDQTCTVCQFVLAPALGHTHKYDDAYSQDETKHWQLCTGCKEPNEAQEHRFDGDCDPDCNVCGYERKITHPAGEWESNEQGHWKTCQKCSQKLEEGEHTWDAGYVKTQATAEHPGVMVYRCTACMLERQEAISQLPPLDPAGGLAWWAWLAIGAGGGIAVTSLVWVLIVMLSVKKKSKGRFSNR